MKRMLSGLLALCFALLLRAPASAQAALPEGLVGEWAGRGVGAQADIALSLVIGEDGRASYTFTQGRYEETQAVVFAVKGDAFEMLIPFSEQSSTGAYALDGDELTLNISTKRAADDANPYEYTVLLHRVAAAEVVEAAPPAVAAPSVEVPAIAPPVEIPSAIAPSVEIPAIAPPAVVAPSVEVPAIAPPAVAAPSVEVPAIAPPAVAAPSVEVPAIAPPAVAAPSVEVPAIAPPVEIPSAIAPSVDVPSIAPTADAPAVAAAAATLAPAATFLWRGREMYVRYIERVPYPTGDERADQYDKLLVRVAGVDPDDPPRIDDLAAVAEGDFRVINLTFYACPWEGFTGVSYTIRDDRMGYAETQPDFALVYQISKLQPLDDLTLTCPGGERIPLRDVPRGKPEE